MSPRRLRLALASVALAGAGLTGYLTVTSLADTTALCPTSGCEVVLSSRYSELFGVPISALGMLAFLALLGSATHARGAPLGRRRARRGPLRGVPRRDPARRDRRAVHALPDQPRSA